MTHKYAIVEREKYGPAANVLADSINALEIEDAGDKKKVCDLTFEKILDICKSFKTRYDISMCGFSSPTLRKIVGATRRRVGQTD